MKMSQKHEDMEHQLMAEKQEIERLRDITAAVSQMNQTAMREVEALMQLFK